ncbi:cell-cell adhesion [Branchiostoma belcheri]|nr:cell-cell adhesion [Branchiostoma belcheri]
MYETVLLVVVLPVFVADAAVYRTVPQSTAVLLGHDVTLNCSLSGLSEQDVVNWHWYNRASQAKHHHISAGSVVAPEFSRYSIVGDTGGGEFNLRIQNARLEDEGKYQCSAFSVEGATTVQLFVIADPSLCGRHVQVRVVLYAGCCRFIAPQSGSRSFPAKLNPQIGNEGDEFALPPPHLLCEQRFNLCYLLTTNCSLRRVQQRNHRKVPALSAFGSYMMQFLPAVPPTVVRITGNLTPRVVGEGLVLSCRSEGGSPIPRLSWYNGTVRNPQSDHAFIMDAETATVAVNLLIPSLTKWDNGANISCVSDQGFPGTVQPKAAWTSLVVYCKYTGLIFAVCHVSPLRFPAAHVMRVFRNPGVVIQCTFNTGRQFISVRNFPWILFLILSGDKKRTIYDGAAGGDTSSYYTCKGDDPPVVTPDRPSVRVAEGHSDVLHMTNVSRTDAGLYECQADNGIKPAAAATVLLDVSYAPTIRKTFDSEISVLYGQDVLRLECVADGNPKPRVWWRRNDTNSLYENPLTLSPMDYRAEGLYECVALSAGFIGARRRTFINVIGRPDVLGDTASIFADEGQEVTLTCEVMSDPPTDPVQWVFRSHSGDEKRLDPGKDGQGVKVKTVAGDTRQDVLTICRIDASYTGTYVCKATNVFGTDQRQFRVHIKISSMLLIVTLCTSAAAATTVLIILAFCLHRLINRFKRSDVPADSRNCGGSETDKTSSDLSPGPSRLESSKGPDRPMKQRTCSTLLSDNNVSCDELVFPWCPGHHPNHPRVSRQRQLESAMKAKYLAETRKVATRRLDDAEMMRVFRADAHVEVTDQISPERARLSPCKLPPDPGRTKENFETISHPASKLDSVGQLRTDVIPNIATDQPRVFGRPIYIHTDTFTLNNALIFTKVNATVNCIQRPRL